MLPYRLLLVDDEKPARRRLRQLLAGASEFVVQAECATAADAGEIIRSDEIDIVLLDIQLRDGTGFDVIQTVGVEAMPPVIFITAFDQHALRAFDVNASGYLMKPITQDALFSNLRRVVRLVENRADTAPATAPAQPSPVPERLHWLAFRQRGRTHLADIDTVDYFQAQGNYVRAHIGTQSHLRRDSISRLERVLDPHRFVRIHRGIIVNIAAIAYMEPWISGDQLVLLRNGTQLRMSRSFRSSLDHLIA